MAVSSGSRIGVIVYEASTIDYTWRAARGYGVESFITLVRTVGVPTLEMTDQRTALKEALGAIGREQVEREGTQAIFPGGHLDGGIPVQHRRDRG